MTQWTISMSLLSMSMPMRLVCAYTAACSAIRYETLVGRQRLYGHVMLANGSDTAMRSISSAKQVTCSMNHDIAVTDDLPSSDVVITATDTHPANHNSYIDNRLTCETKYSACSTVRDVRVLSQSTRYLVVDKPPDMKINSDIETDVTVATQLCQSHAHLVDKNVRFGFRFAHRLDFATSGVLCLALDKKSARLAARAFRRRTVVKHYLALVRGHFSPGPSGEQHIDVPIGRDSRFKTFCRTCVADETSFCDKPRESSTTVVLLEHGLYDGALASKVLLIPHTGRTHQLRVHLAHIGHLVVGDYTYSNQRDVAPVRMMLHALALHMPVKDADVDVRTADPFIADVMPEWVPTRSVYTYDEYVARA